MKSVAPYDVPLWLPSQIGSEIPYDLTLAQIEFKLRRGQAYESLDSIRRALQMSASFKNVKARWVRGQGANTRAHNAIKGIHERIDAGWQAYCKAREALVLLSPTVGTDVDMALRPMVKKDLRPMVDEDGTEGTTRRVLSWIWRTVVDSGDERGWIHDSASHHFVVVDSFWLIFWVFCLAVRVEWAKSRSRSKRHLEEIELVQEEMNRTLRFFLYRTKEWEGRGQEVCVSGPNAGLSADEIEGALAYAERQSFLYHRLHKSCIYAWRNVPAIVKGAQDSIEGGLINLRYDANAMLPSSCKFSSSSSI